MWVSVVMLGIFQTIIMIPFRITNLLKSANLKEFKDTVKSLETLINAKRYYKTKNGKLSDLVLGITQNMECSEDEIKLSIYASAFYDLGLTQIDESIILKDQLLSQNLFPLRMFLQCLINQKLNPLQ